MFITILFAYRTKNISVLVHIERDLLFDLQKSFVLYLLSKNVRVYRKNEEVIHSYQACLPLIKHNYRSIFKKSIYNKIALKIVTKTYKTQLA